MNELLPEEKLINLLLQRETGDLTNQEKKEMEDLLPIFPEWGRDQTIALTAAAISLTAVSPKTSLPDQLRAKILNDSERFFAGSENTVEKSFLRPSPAFVPANENAGIIEKLFGNSFWKWSGWAAAAACALLAVTFWTTRVPKNEIVKNPPVVTTPTVEPTLTEQREKLVTTATDKIQTELTDFNPKQPRGITGDVVWSNSQQKGFVRIHGLPVNDKSEETYQLWIFDAAQNAKTPIDGGVFDVDSNGDLIVPIHAKLKVKTPKMFAVTAEKPGGVVVSKLGKVMTVAKV